jgi:2-haloacid dehalogenase
MARMDPASVKALTFDVFGTVVDWRSSIIRECEAFAKRHGFNEDCGAFADRWRAMYQPAMEEVRSGKRAWTKLDDLHRESLGKLAVEFGFKNVMADELDELNRAWHRLDPWPDIVPGLTRLKRKYVLATLSNGNVALMVNMAKRAGLPWDAILGAEVTRHYKPQPGCYLGTAAMLGLKPDECALVAAHNNDLAVAQGLGFKTIFVPRQEYGPGQTKDQTAERDWSVVARDFFDLADQLAC